jgi:predicted phage-related endonuclease
MVMADVIDGVHISVSLDGITQGYDTTFEHKSLNKNLEAALDAGTIPDMYHPQMEAGLMVSGATRCLFMASRNGDMETARHAWYESNPALRPRIIAACKQFAVDLANYQHVETVAAPVAATIEALPALFVQVEGKVLATNLDAFKLSAQKFIDGIKTELVNDQDFADADKMVKFLKDGEERLALAKSQALSQTASIDELFRTVDAISEQMKAKRLALDKLVKAEKENRRVEIVRGAQDAYMAHVDGLNKRIGDFMPRIVPAFAESIKGLKSLDSMRDKVSATLANGKIEANECADRIQINLATLEANAEHKFLFPDIEQIITKPNGDFMDTVNSRILAHKSAEAERIEAHRIAEERRTAAAVAAAVEAERMTEAKRVAEAAAADQRTSEATHGEPNATALPQAPLASSPPISAEDKRAVLVEAGDDVRAYLNTLDVSEKEYGRLRAVLMGFVQFQAQRGLKVAA